MQVLEFELTEWRVCIFLLLSWLVWFNYACRAVEPEVEPIKQHSYKLHHTRSGFGAKNPRAAPRVYIVAGGSGFIGSWVVRYLLTRKDTVYIFDTEQPPRDVLNSGAKWVDVDLTYSFGVRHELRKIVQRMLRDDTLFVVYNCSVRKRYEAPNFRADLGVAAAENLYIALNEVPTRRVFIIHIGDSLAHRAPIKNLDRFMPSPEMWCQTAARYNEGIAAAASTDPEQNRDRTFSSYAWHQLQVEHITRRASASFSSVAGAAVLRIDGIPSGHAGDEFLTPLIYQGWACVHSDYVPLTVVNIEDVARAALGLEYLLLDPETRPGIDGRSTVVGSSEITTLKHIFAHISRRRQQASKRFWVFRIPPAMVFVLTSLLSIVYTGTPRAKRSVWDNVLRMTPRTLTFARFYSCQVGQLPNSDNEQFQKEVLGVHNNYTLHATLESLLDDIEELERIEAKSKARQQARRQARRRPQRA